MIKSQQSEDENEGFFKPQQKVVQFKQPLFNQIETNSNQQQPNIIVNQTRPNDFKARFITYFSPLNAYPEYLMHNKCQQSDEQLIALPKNFEKVSRKYFTLQEKYQNNQNYKMVYSKLKDLKEFGSYIFSVEALTDYNPNNYILANQPQNSQVPEKQLPCKTKDFDSFNNQSEFEFDSNFQSGNLLYAFQNTQQTDVPTFDLIIQNDTNTKGYNQWFYFSISRNSLLNLNKFQQDIYQTQPKLYKSQQESKSVSPGKKTIRINIVNFIKKHLMFEDGVRPVGMFESQGQWKFIGRETQYKKSYIKRYIEFNGSTITKNYYTLSFLIDFPQETTSKAQKLYIALNYPYPYKRTISFIDSLVSQNFSKDILITKQILCHTLSNNQVPYLVIQSKITQKQIDNERKLIIFKTQKQKQKKKDYLEGQLKQILQSKSQDQVTDQMIKKQLTQRKKKILILARQHPGQTVGSFVLQGFLQHLMDGINSTKQKIQQNQSSGLQHPIIQKAYQNHKKLLKQFSIYVFPIINVDGVIYGNFRTNIVGSDLNRQWIDPNKWLHPQIYNLKRFVQTLTNIEFVLDFHGHSRKLNSFIYACNNPVPNLLQDQNENDYPSIHMFRLYPYIMSKQCDFFSIKDCTYTISRDKIKTARINTFKNLNYNPYVFTFETGFFGYTKNDKKFRYKIDNFFQIGKAALESLKILLLKPKKVKQILKEVQSKGYLFDKWTYENKQDPGSESNPSEDELNPVQKKFKVFSDDKMRENQKGDSIKIKPVKQKINIRKKQKTKKSHRKVETELKSQRTILKIDEDGFKLISSSKSEFNEEKILKPQKGQKIKQLKIEYLNEKKKNTSKLMSNAVTIKEAIMQKVEFPLPQPNYRERVIRMPKKQSTNEDFKSTSNLLGTGIHYFKNRGKQKFFQHPLKTNPATLEMLEVKNFRKDIRIQSFSSDSSHKQIPTKPVQNTAYSENAMKDLFFSLIKPAEKPVYSRNIQQKQRIYVVRQNKIVKIVDNVNKQKSKSTILESQINERHKNLKKCQALMQSDNKILIDEIKEQKNEEKKKKRVYLNPIQY